MKHSNNKFIKFVIVVLIVLSDFGIVVAADIKDQHARCTHHANTRIVTLEYLVVGSSVPCQVVYHKVTEKPGHHQILWHAKNSVGYCERKMDNFLQKLEKYGWQCSYEKPDDSIPTSETTPPPISPVIPTQSDDLSDDTLYPDQEVVTICTRHSKKRILILDYLVEGQRVPCQVVYEKPTEAPNYRQVLWRAKNSVGYCERKMDNFLQKLEGYSWQCSYKKQISDEIFFQKPAVTPPQPKPTTPIESLQMDSYMANCGTQQIELQKPLTKIAQELTGLKYNKHKLQDCSGIFHQVLIKFKHECPHYNYPSVREARDTKSIAKWYHQRGELTLVHDPLAKSRLIKPGAVMFYADNVSTNQPFSAADLFVQKTGVTHLGVVIAVDKNAKGQIINYQLFHGRSPGKASKITHYHTRKPTRAYYPPFGNGKAAWVAIAPLVNQFESTPSSSSRVVTQYGEASYYADSLHGNRTANGEIYDKNKLTAAHLTLPFGTRVRVTYLKTNKSVEVVINDRGPYIPKRIIDLSRKAAEQVDLIRDGHGKVTVEILNTRQGKNE